MLGDRANIVCLYKILEKYSDEEHILSMSDITGYFMQDYGMKIDRRAVYGAADTLIELGYDISVYKENGKGYYLRSRLFEPSEVRLMTDVVYSMHSIPQKQTADLLENFNPFSAFIRGSDLNTLHRRMRTERRIIAVCSTISTFSMKQFRAREGFLSIITNTGWINGL